MFTPEDIHSVFSLIGQDDALNCSIEFLYPCKRFGTYLIYPIFIFCLEHLGNIHKKKYHCTDAYSKKQLSSSHFAVLC